MSDFEPMTDGAKEPTPAAVAAWIGDQNFRRWTELRDFINRIYPGVFVPEWLFGGKKHGWNLRYKKSKSFCTLIPERKRFRVLLVFGGEGRQKAEAVLSSLVSHIGEDYRNSPTFHDGKWLFATVDSAKALDDVKRLLEIKRKPKNTN